MSSDNPASASPDCGHTYRQAGTYSVTVTIGWQVTWAGAGAAGAFNDLTTQAAETVTVDSAPAVITR